MPETPTNPALTGVSPWELLGFLSHTLERTGTITVTDWNQAITHLTGWDE